MEIIDQIDKNNNVIGEIEKATAHKVGLRHRVAAGLVKYRNSYLITKAADYKVEAGGLYHSVGGHVLSGEDYLTALIRETREEVGLRINKSQVNLIGSYWFEKEYESRIEKERFQVYIINTTNPKDIKLNKEHYNPEWFSKSDLKDLLMNDSSKLSAPLNYTLKNLFFKDEI
jgi:8-oxo-dGTP pyrophosphatase MutT (NUDIX family)